jgi:DNA mismatch endonuclease (patch repair protein)
MGTLVRHPEESGRQRLQGRSRRHDVMTTRRTNPMPDVHPTRRAIMRSNRRRDTGPELAIRRAVHEAGLRYRVDFPIRVADHRPIRPDLVFTRRRVAVFVDGCFWHGCPAHATSPATRARFWADKVAANRERDRRHDALLAGGGWTVLRIWEHEDPVDAAKRIAAVVRAIEDSEKRA